MRKRDSLYFCLSFFLLLLCHACTNDKSDSTEQAPQKYITVEAKVRKYLKDGTRIYTEYQPFETRTVDLLVGFDPPEEPVKLSKYGGRLDLKAEATGFFQVKKIDGRWWAIDPEGYYYFNIALNSIRPGRSERNQRVLAEKYGTTENWMKETIVLLQENGFNCAGSWSDAEAIAKANKSLERPMAYCINLNFMSSYGKVRGGTYQLPGHIGYPKDAIFVFDPAFEAFCDKHAAQLSLKKMTLTFLDIFQIMRCHLN